VLDKANTQLSSPR